MRGSSIIAAGAALLIAAAVSTSALAAGDAKNGAKVFAKCKACHTIKEGGKQKLGPNLHGLFGRKAATAAGFKYSEAMQGSGIVWDEKILDEYLTNPSKLVPKTKMKFKGLEKAAQRANVIEYLKGATK